MNPRLSRGEDSTRSGATPPPLFGLASHGVFPASAITRTAVRSYRTFSPLLAGEPAGGIFSVALIRGARLSANPRLLAGMLPCEDRTFLSARTKRTQRLPDRAGEYHSRRIRLLAN